MSDTAVGARYAQAFFDVCPAGQGDSLARALEAVAAAYRSSAELRSVLSNPVVPIDKREAILSAVISGVGGDDLTRRSLLVMLRRGRIGALSEAAESLRTLVDQAAGVLRGDVTTATAMPDSFFADLEQKLSVRHGRRVVLARTVDPTLLGGVVTTVDGQTMDQSVRGQLDRIERELLDSVRTMSGATGSAQAAS